MQRPTQQKQQGAKEFGTFLPTCVCLNNLKVCCELGNSSKEDLMQVVMKVIQQAIMWHVIIEMSWICWKPLLDTAAKGSSKSGSCSVAFVGVASGLGKFCNPGYTICCNWKWAFYF